MKACAFFVPSHKPGNWQAGHAENPVSAQGLPAIRLHKAFEFVARVRTRERRRRAREGKQGKQGKGRQAREAREAREAGELGKQGKQGKHGENILKI